MQDFEKKNQTYILHTTVLRVFLPILQCRKKTARKLYFITLSIKYLLGCI